MACRPSDHINELDTERKCADPHQRRRRRKETLLKMLYDYYLECYSDINLIIAKYPIRNPSNSTIDPVPCRYITVHFSVDKRVNPKCDLGSLSRKRIDRKTTLEGKLDQYHRDCKSDIFISISEHLVDQTTKRRWQPSIQIFTKRLVKNETKLFPPPKEELEKQYPPPAQITLENYSKSTKSCSGVGQPSPS
ncbi:uncharacterized protein CIMG_06315 [Coccidioides immitis RS]|uniref:Uncharacterized protein n=1 Tax=Coccidioides immitis (strain RS) TaxID=246410 RepID=J3K7W5_COCIM|nr:uncharacterized protein CIMG_06315 [Coccidioides immitis RS]EAS30836.3 hypothetical protein CIMG_06315 [Coccidioides immitis RS]